MTTYQVTFANSAQVLLNQYFPILRQISNTVIRINPQAFVIQSVSDARHILQYLVRVVADLQHGVAEKSLQDYDKFLKELQVGDEALSDENDALLATIQIGDITVVELSRQTAAIHSPVTGILAMIAG